ncbi:hypothetical protein SHJG_6606 [Streptomyces hygroscopicus subsp. jinggangensis 5008]|nr:hypothetical protein SHJG_6606 [Streptomyces hygroscopicus subsp. jinggangensis 5008]AGF66029.1 hypothetical protein SHJGH_6366 [Streptomyces hygroscopicus subsp. jinggangensis TL01]
MSRRSRCAGCACLRRPLCLRWWWLWWLVWWPRLRAPVRQGRRRRLRRVGSFVHRPCIARRPPHESEMSIPGAEWSVGAAPVGTIHQYRHAGT